MSLTNFPNGISSFGIPQMGSARYGWKDASNTYFVDGTDGSDGNDGKEPASAFLTVEAGLAAMNAYDVLYIMENAFVDTDPTYYKGATGNHTIAVANTGVAIVGVSHAGQMGYPMTPYLMGYDATETPLFTVNAPLVGIENLHFSGGWANAMTTTAGIAAPNSTGTSSAVPQALSVHNCSFEDLEAATPGGAGGYPNGGISIQGTWYTVISHCRFRNCVSGVTVISATSTTVCTTIEHNIFHGDTATDINVDIYYYCQGSSGLLINDNYMAHLLPAHASGDTLKYIMVAAGESGLITNNHVGAVQGTPLTVGSAGTAIQCPDNMGHGCNWTNGALMAEAT